VFWRERLLSDDANWNDCGGSAFLGAHFGLQRRFAMPALLGFILGVAVTILGVYEYDSTTGRTANGLSATAAGGKAPMVNWDVVSTDWRNFQDSVRSTTDDIEHKLKQHSG
jgi:hypothetical protein